MATASDNITLESWFRRTSCSHRFYHWNGTCPVCKIDIGAEMPMIL